MSKIYNTVSSCLLRTPASEQTEVITSEHDIPEEADNQNECMKSADKKTDEELTPTEQHGMLWRLSSGLYSTTTGAVSYGVGGVKWVAGKGYSAGSAVVSTGVTVASKIKSVPLRKKDKNE